MAKPFIVSCNFSNCVSFTGNEKVFSLYVDPAKTSIIYEFRIWMQWMFALKNCIYLKHNNSVIHDFEDILILCHAKYVDVFQCSPGCLHVQNSNIKLLEKLNVYNVWSNNVVPNCFIDKLKTMSGRLTLNSEPAVENIFPQISNTTQELDNNSDLVPHVEAREQQPPISASIDTEQEKSDIVLVQSSNSARLAIADAEHQMSPKLDGQAPENLEQSRSARTNNLKLFGIGETLNQLRTSINDEEPPIKRKRHRKHKKTAKRHAQEMLNEEVKTEPWVSPVITTNNQVKHMRFIAVDTDEENDCSMSETSLKKQEISSTVVTENEDFEQQLKPEFPPLQTPLENMWRNIPSPVVFKRNV